MAAIGRGCTKYRKGMCCNFGVDSPGGKECPFGHAGDPKTITCISATPGKWCSFSADTCPYAGHTDPQPPEP